MSVIIAIPKLGPGLMRMYMGAQYALALRKAGAKARWVDTAEAACQCDGLLIPGGDDIHPKLYGQAISEKCGKQNPLRDRLDPMLMEAFLKTGKPMLGICRGMQMMNVFFGGTLYQDIKDVQKLNHSQLKKLKKTCHGVKVEEDSLLYRLTGKVQLEVNTAHHQAADQPAPKLRITARSTDGIVEAVEWPEHPFFLGVQWHPENLRQQEDHLAIIRGFVKACEK